MEKDFKNNLTVSVVSLLGFIFSFLSPIRDPIANYMIVLGFLLTTIILVINMLFRVFRIFRIGHPVYFSIKIVNIMLTLVIIIGLIGGNFVGAWSPFFFLPFGYYIFLSTDVTYILFFNLSQLTILYRQTQEDIPSTNKLDVTINNVLTCSNGHHVNSDFVFCPQCGIELNVKMG